jgi:hypothetical protein
MVNESKVCVCVYVRGQVLQSMNGGGVGGRGCGSGGGRARRTG